MEHGAWNKSDISHLAFRIANLTRPSFRNGESNFDGNSKFQITNDKQITITEIQNSKTLDNLIKENSNFFGHWNFEFICNFGAWDLGFRNADVR